MCSAIATEVRSNPSVITAQILTGALSNPGKIPCFLHPGTIELKRPKTPRTEPRIFPILHKVNAPARAKKFLLFFIRPSAIFSAPLTEEPRAGHIKPADCRLDVQSKLAASEGSEDP